MTVTIPTGDLLGLLADVIPLAGEDPDYADTYCVRLEWDGDMLHALATDGTRAGISSWHPDDLRDDDDQPALIRTFGADDDPWRITMGRADAEDLVKKFKLPAKQLNTPLMLRHQQSMAGHDRIRVIRGGEGGRPALEWGVGEFGAEMPDIRAGLRANDQIRPVTSVKLNGLHLGAFATVRQRGGPMELTFTGTDSMVLVSIGDRFVGGVQPVRQAAHLHAVA